MHQGRKIQHWIQRLCLLTLIPKLILFHISAAVLERLHWTIHFIGLALCTKSHQRAPFLGISIIQHSVVLHFLTVPYFSFCSFILDEQPSEYIWSVEQQALGAVLPPISSFCRQQGLGELLRSGRTVSKTCCSTKQDSLMGKGAPQ